MSTYKYCFVSFLIFACLLVISPIMVESKNSEQRFFQTTKGWNILSDDLGMGLKTLDVAAKYGVNHLQLSHHVVHNLKDIRNRHSRELVHQLTAAAHDRGIDDVLIWDHALYGMDYYPEAYKVEGKINLDDEAFWEWFKKDYREMLEMSGDIDGIVLTFIETGARVEHQLSNRLITPQQKLAFLVDQVADVVVDEFGMKLCIRTFMYNKDELENILGCLEFIQHKDIVVMQKEQPHDFFLTHPPITWIDRIPFPVIIEFDAAHEYNGQGILLSAYPSIHMERAKRYIGYENVAGFVLRSDRYGSTSLVHRPHEINAFCVHAIFDNPDITLEEVVDEFIAQTYGERTLPLMRRVYQKAPEIGLSILYTLGLNTANHTRLDFKYRSIYMRSNSGRWMEDPNIFIKHGVNRQFHYWKDIAEHLSPAIHKTNSELNRLEIQEVLDQKWLSPKERMTYEYLQYITEEKDYGVRLAEEVFIEIEANEVLFEDASRYKDLLDTAWRTVLSARVRRGVAKAYYASRVIDENEAVRVIKNQGLEEILAVIPEMEAHSRTTSIPRGEYNWEEEASIALDYYNELK